MFFFAEAGSIGRDADRATRTSVGLYSYGLYSYGLYSHGLYSCGLFIFGDMHGDMSIATSVLTSM